MQSSKFRVGIIGSGNWGTTIAKIIASNAARSEKFEPQVRMWVFEEIIEEEKLTDIINNRHENVKYLPGVKLPHNLVAVSDLASVASNASHLVFVMPHQFIEKTCDLIAPLVSPSAVGISLIKGLMDHSSELVLVSRLISQKLNIPVSVLSGANIASEIAAEKLSTSTIGCTDPEVGKQWLFLTETPYFAVSLIDAPVPMEIFGALKNCAALGIGFGDALGFGINAKSSAIRIAFTEIIRFIRLYEPNVEDSVFLQSFGLDDLITTCFAGRNVRAAELHIRNNTALHEIESTLLNGQKLQGPGTIQTVMSILKKKNKVSEFPFLEYVYGVLQGDVDPGAFHLVLSSRK